MKLVKKLEQILAKKTKSLPQLPENARKWFADAAWVFALVSAVLGVIVALGLLSGVLLVAKANAPIQGIYVSAPVEVGRFMFAAWLAFISLLATSALLAMAVSKLKSKTKAGWDLLFMAELAFIGFSVLNWLQYTPAVASFVQNLIVSAASLYVLFQIRDKFHKPAQK